MLLLGRCFSDKMAFLFVCLFVSCVPAVKCLVEEDRDGSILFCFPLKAHTCKEWPVSPIRSCFPHNLRITVDFEFYPEEFTKAKEY